MGHLGRKKQWDAQRKLKETDDKVGVGSGESAGKSELNQTGACPLYQKTWKKVKERQERD